MSKIAYKIKGHESFAIRDGWLTKGMSTIKKDNRVFKVNSGADALGVGTNMAKSIRYWLKAANLVTDSSAKGVNLTELGEAVFENDPYLEDVFSLWIIHINIAANIRLATSWNLFFNELGIRSSFTREDLFELMKAALSEFTGEQELSVRSIRDDCGVLLQMYSGGSRKNDDPEEKKTSPFEGLGLISRTGARYTKKRPPVDLIDPLVILYMIVDELNAHGSMQIDHVVDGRDMPGKLLNLNRIVVNGYLDDLQNQKMIAVERTAGLDIIYPADCMDYDRTKIIREYFERKTLT